MSNFKFDDEVHEIFRTAANDPALADIRWQAWFLYSDLYEHRLTGAYRASRQTRRVVARFTLFLCSDLEYRWPRQRCLLRRAFDMIGGREREEPQGEEDVWPFFCRRDFNRARSRYPAFALHV